MADVSKEIGKTESWGTRWGLILSAIGMAVGTGNIWRFPRVAAANGGGPFIVLCIVALFLWGIPIMMAEAVLGKSTRFGVIGSFKKFIGEKYTWMGGIVAWISLCVAFYYAVVVGYCLRYSVYSFSGVIKNGLDTELLWTTFSNNAADKMTFHVIAMILCTLVIMKGVQAGIERINKVLIPSLFIMLIVLMLRAVTLPGAINGLEYLFSPANIKLFGNAKVWLEAFTQIAWSTGAGWGLMLTYFVYVKEDEDISLNATTVCFADTSAGMLAAMVVLPTIFALSSDPGPILAAGNSGITFIHLTKLFTVMPMGRLAAILFFLSLSFAALSSLLSMVELGVRLLLDMGWTRTKAALFAGVAILILGLPSSYSMAFQDNQDWVWGVGLLASGVFITFAMMKYGINKSYEDFIAPTSNINAKWIWNLLYLVPVIFVILFTWWIWQAATWYPGEWMKWLPISQYTFTVGTMFYQWIPSFIVIFMLNKWFNKVMKYPAVLD